MNILSNQHACRASKRQRGECQCCPQSAAPGRVRCQGCLDKAAKVEAARRKADKKACFDHYGRTCTCCNVMFEEIFLVLDHVKNDGARHRREIRAKGGRLMYLWARKNGFPDTLQTHCWNCNAAKGLNGICPHQLGARSGSPGQAEELVRSN